MDKLENLGNFENLEKFWKSLEHLGKSGCLSFWKIVGFEVDSIVESNFRFARLLDFLLFRVVLERLFRFVILYDSVPFSGSFAS